jgi:hypothetical protein
VKTRAILLGALVGALLSTSAMARCDVGAFAGVTVLDSTVVVGDTKLVDQGGDAAMAGLRAGCGYRWPAGLYLGAEAEVFASQGRSRAVVNGVGYSLDLNGGTGAFARVGWETRGSALFYGRAGVQAIFTSQGTQVVPAIGIGAEVPFAPRWRARVDITYAWNSVEYYQMTAGVAYSLQRP